MKRFATLMISVLLGAFVMALLITSELRAQDPVDPAGQSYLGTIITLGIDPYIRSLHGSALQKLTLPQQSFEGEGVSIIKNAKVPPSPFSKAQPFSHPVSDIPPGHFLQPVWCGMGHHQYLFIIAREIKSGLVSAMAHHYQSTPLDQIQWKKNRDQFKPLAIDSMYEEALQKIAGLLKENKRPEDQMQPHLKLRIGSSSAKSSIQDEWKQCFDLIAAERLLEFVDVDVASMAFALPFAFRTKQLQRHQRSLVLDWRRPNNDLMKLEGARISDSIFAHQLDQLDLGFDFHPYRSEAFDIEPLIDQLKPMILKIDSDMRRQDPPRIVRQYGAWIFLDRGRAYGLQLYDRLIDRSTEGNHLKAHVVRYFSKVDQVKDLSGNLIEDGAIAFVRKGQNMAKIGEVLIYDPRAYPTPWPPED